VWCVRPAGRCLPGLIRGAHGFAEASPAGVGGVAQHAQITDRSQRVLPVRVGTPVAVSQRASSAIVTPSST
jgi:hypothetical protein